MKTPRKSAKSIRNEDTRRRQMPIQDWLANAGFTPEQIAAMAGGEDKARLAGLIK